jgi:hypothetical protein
MDISPVGRKAKYMYYLEGGSVTKKLIDIRVFGVELGVLGSLDRVIDKENV